MYYEKYTGGEVVLTDWKGDKLMRKLMKHIKYDEIITGEDKYNSKHDKYVYEVKYTDIMADKLTANIIAENIISQVDSEGQNY